MRKKILEHDWLEIEKQESNPTQTWHRLRDMTIRAINDLTLLAQKLPEDKQKEIFTHSLIEGLITQLLYGGRGRTYSKPDTSTPRRAQLAAMLVGKGTGLNSHQFELLNRDTPSLVEPTTNHLRQAVNICKDISRKLELIRIEEEAEQDEIVYLFSWSRMWYIDKHRLEEFIFNETGESLIEIPIPRSLTWDEKKFECTFSAFEKGAQSPDSEINVRTISITMNDTNTQAEVLIFDSNQNIIYKKELLVKPAENDINDFNLYMKEQRKKKKKRS
jgi:hypothetical protein